MKSHTLRVWSLNCRNSDKVQKYVLDIANGHNVDILLLQDICNNTGRVIETCNGPPNPSNASGAQARKDTKNNKLKPQMNLGAFCLPMNPGSSDRVAIYVRRDLAVSAYQVHPLDHWRSTLSIVTRFDTVHIHCIYNVNATQIPIETLRNMMSGPGQHLMVGDFNLHHTWWGGRRARKKQNPQSRALADAFRDELELRLLTETCARTYEMAAHDKNRWSSIDMAFATKGTLILSQTDSTSY